MYSKTYMFMYIYINIRFAVYVTTCGKIEKNYICSFLPVLSEIYLRNWWHWLTPRRDVGWLTERVEESLECTIFGFYKSTVLEVR